MARPSDRAGTKKEFRSLISPSGMNLPGEFQVKAPETPTERSHRHRIEVREFWVKEAPVHLAAIGIAISGTPATLILTLRPGSSTDDKTWAYSVLCSLLVVIAGFAFGKAAK